MKKIVFLVAFILGGIHFSFSQEEVKNELNLILPSSTSYSLGSYGQHSIGMFTGTVQEQIELYNYKANDLVVPITLSYSSNGIKVDQAENNVGIGWVLNGGGVITRVVNGRADERRSNKLPPDVQCHDQEMVNYVYHNSSSRIDTEPDLFLFNFLGRSGQFTLDDNKQVLLLEQEDLEIKMLKGTDQNYYFTVRDERGVTYVFDQRETTSTQYDHSNDSAVTAWYLKSITSPSGAVINFEYKQDSQSFTQVASRSIKLIKRNNFCSNKGIPWEYVINRIHTSMSTVTLSRVYSNNPQDGEIELKYDHRRPYNAVTIKEPILISEVVFRDNRKQEVDNIKFNYTTTRNKRTFLEGIQFKEPNKTYQFEYHDAERLNERFGNKDAWGYNSSKGGDFPDPIKNYMLIGETRLGYEKYVSVGDNYTDLDYVQAGLLKKIIFPTKGYSEFNYEANRVWGPDFIPAQYGIVSMSLMHGYPQDPVYFKTRDQNSLETELSLGFYDPNYNPGGTEYPIDQEGFYFNLDKESPKGSGRYIRLYSRLTTEKVNIAVLRKFDVEPFTRYKLTGVYTGHANDRVGGIRFKIKISNDTTVAKAIAVNGLFVSGIRSYSADGQLALEKKYTYKEKDGSSSGNHYFDKYQYITSGKELVICESTLGAPSYYDYSTTIHTNSLLSMNDAIGEGRLSFRRGVEETQYANGSNSTIEYIYQQRQGMTGYQCINGTYAGPPKWTKSDWGHGLLLEKNSFNEKQEQVQSERYEYTEDVLKRKEVRGLATEIQFMPAVGYVNNGTNINPLNIEHIGYTMYSVNSFRSYLKSITTIDYTGNKQMQEKKTFDYSSSKHYQKTKMEVANETTTITEQYVYPDDILSSTSLTGEPLTTGEYQEINRLKKTATHQPAALIQTNTYKDGTLNGISRNLYKNWNNTPLYHKTISSKGTGNFNPADFQVTHYNKNSKVEETEDQSGSKTVYLYGYGQTLLLARIQNATKEQVASALGVSIANLITIDETKLTQLNNLRTNTALKDALITTYEHKPLVGITKMTDPKGSSMSYEYDLFNRLKAIKDSKGNIIEEYEYNYKNNQ
ncbi:hypothetical protein [Myroides sp. TSA_177.3]|uniref:hypothetical protein n=1 Tax=Myroides sp. TSA_177.3 TaxID=3415650 RepID=UPI004045E7B5